MTESNIRKTGRAHDDAFFSLAARSVCLDAEAARVVWCRVKGYPWWLVALCCTFSVGRGMRPCSLKQALQAERGAFGLSADVE
jgi:hypothetical protein